MYLFVNYRAQLINDEKCIKALGCSWLHVAGQMRIFLL